MLSYKINITWAFLLQCCSFNSALHKFLTLVDDSRALKTNCALCTPTIARDDEKSNELKRNHDLPVINFWFRSAVTYLEKAGAEKSWPECDWWLPKVRHQQQRREPRNRLLNRLPKIKCVSSSIPYVLKDKKQYITKNDRLWWFGNSNYDRIGWIVFFLFNSDIVAFSKAIQYFSALKNNFF